jgi:hypothetical protein
LFSLVLASIASAWGRDRSETGELGINPHM